jgi:hypothetical protein
VTGRPHTLIFNGSVKLPGAVGLALSGDPLPVAHTAFPGLRAITAPLKVTQYAPLSSSTNALPDIPNADQRVTWSTSWTTQTRPRCSFPLSRKARSQATRPEMTSFTLAYCGTASFGSYIISWLVGLRAERWRLILRRLLGRARPFRYVAHFQRTLIFTHACSSSTVH